MRDKKEQRKHMPKKKKKKITHTRQYLRGSAICIHPWSCRDFTIIREKLQSAATVFHSLKNDNNNKTLIIKKRFLYPAHSIHNGLQNGPKIFRLGPLHGLSLRKSPIKNHATLFQVGSGRQLD